MTFPLFFFLGLGVIFLCELLDSGVESNSASLPQYTSMDESLILNAPTMFNDIVFIGVHWLSSSEEIYMTREYPFMVVL